METNDTKQTKRKSRTGQSIKGIFIPKTKRGLYRHEKRAKLDCLAMQEMALIENTNYENNY